MTTRLDEREGLARADPNLSIHLDVRAVAARLGTTISSSAFQRGRRMPDESVARLARLESQVAELQKEVRALRTELSETKHSIWRQKVDLEWQVWLEGARRKMDRAFDGLEERLSRRR
jgi:hypothetical protein